MGLYIHIPFCLRKCPYCSFYSIGYNEDTAESYVQAVIRNVRAYKGRDISADTIYFGGGTPSLLTDEQISRIISECRECFELHSPEITLEANPCTVDLEKLVKLRKTGVNRLSFGIQSADDEQLRKLGRLHDFKKAVEAIENAAKAGFDNISGDLMLGIQGQDEESLMKTLDSMTKLPLTHISAYMLKIEEGTPFYKEETFKSTADEDLMSRLYKRTVDELDRRNFKQYEISNFAKDGRVSKHNLKYWHGDEYLGFGTQAHSFFEGVRYFCSDSVSDYITKDIQDRTITEESVNSGEEYVLLGLRLNEGIDIDRIKGYFSDADMNRFVCKAKLLETHDLVRILGNRISLTTEGMLVSNSVIFELLDTLDNN